MGQTASANFPTVAPFQARLKGTADGFVSRLSADGTSLEYSTYLGGSDWDGLTGVEATPQGVLVSGFMYSSDMPTSAATQTWFGAPYDGYVARIVAS